jgi:hypothetical protein
MIPFEHSFASHPKSENWHPTKNGDITPRDVFLNCSKPFWFTCSDCRHDINPRLNDVVRGRWCVYCSSKKLCKKPECQWCHDHSFASHPRAVYWHPTKNGDVTPRDVFLNTHSRFWFTCPDCRHDINPYLTTVAQGRWCVYCGSNNLCDNPVCQWCHDHSFASHPKAVYWHPTLNGDVTPRDVFLNCNKKFWFECPDCRHDINPYLNNVEKDRWCGYCSSPPKLLCKKPECQWCHDHSFASHSRAVYWHPTKNGYITPRDVFLSCNKKFWFTCPDCQNDIKPQLNNIVNGKWCIICTNKTEKKFHNFAKKFFPRISKNIRPEGTTLPMDMYTPENQTYHEIDGDQHFEDSKFYTSRTAEENRNHDVTKMVIALRDEGRSVIRIYQPWVWEDKGDWQKRWQDAVSRIDQDKPAVYFIGPEGTYDKHKEDILWKLGNRFEMKSIV